jgi:DNA-binding SARP family transcriptional activator
MESFNHGTDERLLPEIVAVFQAVDGLRQRLLASPAAFAVELAAAADPPLELHRVREDHACHYQANFFGGFALHRDDRPVALGRQWSSLELCRYLIAQRGRLVPRDELLEVLWPDASDSPNGLHRLHVAVSAVRRLVDPAGASRSLIQLEGECYAVPVDVVDTDFARFEVSFGEAKRCLARGDDAGAADAFRAAITLYRGDFLADHPYAEWTHLLRDHFRERRLTALTDLCECAERAGDLGTVFELAAEILAVDNLRETAHRHLMRACYYSGERGLAIRQYENCARLLRTELGVDPSPHTWRLYQAIRDDGDLPREPSSIL